MSDELDLLRTIGLRLGYRRKKREKMARKFIK